MPYDFSPYRKQLTSTEEWLKKELQQVRTGQASPSILDSVRVEVYGAPMAIKELASILIEGARTLRIAPWDPKQSKDIEKAITASNLGVSVAVDDQGLRINFPELTADRRKEIVKIARDKHEEAKKQVRGHRDHVIKDIQTKEKDGGMGRDEIFRLKNEVQKITDEINKKFDEITAKKEKEILN